MSRVLLDDEGRKQCREMDATGTCWQAPTEVFLRVDEVETACDSLQKAADDMATLGPNASDGALRGILHRTGAEHWQRRTGIDVMSEPSCTDSPSVEGRLRLLLGFLRKSLASCMVYRGAAGFWFYDGPDGHLGIRVLVFEDLLPVTCDSGYVVASDPRRGCDLGTA